jgi:colicin import membrane protein
MLVFRNWPWSLKRKKMNLPSPLSFKKSLSLSFSVHGIILFFAFVSSLWFFKTSSQDDYKIEIIKASVKVDVVAMPKMSLQELKKLSEPEPVIDPGQENSEEKNIEIKKDDVIEEVKSPKKSLSNLLADYSKKEIKKSKPKKQEGIELAGNKLSTGSLIVGDRSDSEASAFSLYVQTIPEKIKFHWRLPSYLKELNLKCRIRIYLSAQGHLLKAMIFESSGNDDYDQRAMNAIKKASPFSAPDPEAAKGIATKGIVLGFPL